MSAISTSYQQLPKKLKRIFRLLSIFPSSFTAKAAKAICEADTFNHLSELNRMALVEFDKANHRYHLHDLVRDFAYSKLKTQEEATTCKSFVAYYLQFAQQHAESDTRSYQALSQEEGNLKRAQALAAQNEEWQALADFLLALRYFVDLGNNQENSLQYLANLFASESLLPDLSQRGRLALLHGSLLYRRGFPQKALSYFEQCEEIGRDIGDANLQQLGGYNRALALLDLAANLEDIENTKSSLENSLELAKRNKDQRAILLCWQQLSKCENALGKLSLAEQYAGDAINSYHQSGMNESRLLANSYYLRAVNYYEQDQIDKAEIDYQKALEMAQQSGDNFKIAESYAGLAEIVCDKKIFNKAEDLLNKAKMIAEPLQYQDLLEFLDDIEVKIANGRKSTVASSDGATT